MKASFTTSFSRSSYVSEIQTPTGEHVNVDNEVEVPGKNKFYLQIIFTAENFYGTRKPTSETTMLQAGTRSRNAKTFHKIWFGKAFWFLDNEI